MLNPNLSGYAANRRLRRVDFPVPDGPNRTRGRENADMGMMNQASVKMSRSMRCTRAGIEEIFRPLMGDCNLKGE